MCGEAPDWGEAAQTALELIFPQLIMSFILLTIKRLTPV